MTSVDQQTATTIKKVHGLRITDVAKTYGNVVAIDGLSLDVPRGSMIGFLGPNGAGKTTTMRAIVGMVRLDRGAITWDGRPIDDSIRNRIGYMPQERGLYARMRVKEQVVYFGRLAGLSQGDATNRADYWLKRVGLTERAESMVQDLSGGNQQRVQLAVALVHDPDLLVLDEPFAGLDPVAAEELRAIISERAGAGAGVLFSSHQLDLVEGLCEEIVVVAAGRLVTAGRLSDLQAASPERRLKVRWTRPVDRWQPGFGSLRSFDGISAEVDITADADFGSVMGQALSAGPVSEIGIEPPGLSRLFNEWVSRSDIGEPAP